MYYGLIFISVTFAGIGWLLSQRLRGVFAKYARVPIASGMNGAQVAEAMLRHYGISDVRIVQGQGTLSDHYNPTDKTVNLSPDVYRGRNVSAASVAAHECGHAVQHATAYSMLQLRSKLVPVVSISARLQQYLFMFGFMLVGASGGAAGGMGQVVLLVAIAAFAVTALFAIVTLPVEFDASRRALAWLETSGTAVGVEHEGAKTTLWWAAMTYVAAALAAVTQLLFLLARFLGSRD